MRFSFDFLSFFRERRERAFLRVFAAAGLAWAFFGGTYGTAYAEATTGGVPLDRTAGPRVERLAGVHESARASTPGLRACSFRRQACVVGNDPNAILRTLESIERMWDTAEVLDWGEPRMLTVQEDALLGADVHVTYTNMRPLASFDEADAEVRLAPRLSGCTLDAAVLRAILEVGTLSRTPALPVSLREGWSSAMVQGALPCTTSDREGRVFSVQADPGRNLLGLGPESSSARASAPEVFLSWLDAHYGRSLLLATAAMSATHTNVGEARWIDEPDPFDVWNENLKNLQFRDSEFFDVVTDFAIDRFFFGRDPSRFPESARLPAIVPDWDVPLPDSPRRLLGPHPLAPFGSTYLLVRVGDKKALRMEAAWESFARIRWYFVKLDASMHELGRVAVPAPNKASEAQMTLSELGGAAFVLLVGTNFGDPAEPFDPDWSSMEPHNYTVTLSVP